MKAISTAIADVLVFEPIMWYDQRGFFFESFSQKRFEEAVGRSLQFVQDNHSRSIKGVLRGLHYQIRQPQGKLVRVLHGEIFDVAVDIRRSSKSFGKWVGTTMSAHDRKQIWIPEGFAHGYQVLSDSAEVLYKATEFYAPEYERAIAWNDGDLNIAWPLPSPTELSAKDRDAPSFLKSELFE